MKNLLSTPDFCRLLCLRKLTLCNCEELKEIHPSLGCHMGLEYVSVLDCYKLKKFPTIVRMRNLGTLEIQFCNDTLEFPEIQSNMESLVKLSLRYMRIDVLLSSIGERCVNLISLYLLNYTSLKSIEVDFDGLKHLEEFTFCGLNHLKTRNQLCISRLVGKVSCGKDWYTSHPSIRLWLTHSLTKLYLCDCGLRDGEIPSNIGELYNLQELHLGGNDFTRLEISLLQLNRLKLLILDGCKELVELPELPSGLYILYADTCHRLKAIGHFHKSCKYLSGVSLLYGSFIIGGARLLETMLQGNAVEHHSMMLCLQGIEIAKGFASPLLRESKCTLKLPENWCNDFCGFLICFISYRKILKWRHITLSTEHVMNDIDSEEDMVWDESDNDMYTRVWYVSFGSLRHTAWWDETKNMVSFSINMICGGFGVRPVPRRSGSGPTQTSAHYDGESRYAPKFRFLHDSAHGLDISF
ncbi:hypothetical protein M8C21_024445 [Ambrosia artemisiifolia]|uniref:Uncharacterized protein n=1 Tax=Ambrosia artemisiifolia TaxID=4212 RepID=A0AAD5GHX7_AMBAR|nr:hypothetical protein M8C21_024445 [Ambrosia artemisiifolia]